MPPSFEGNVLFNIEVWQAKLNLQKLKCVRQAVTRSTRDRIVLTGCGIPKVQRSTATVKYQSITRYSSCACSGVRPVMKFEFPDLRPMAWMIVCVRRKPLCHHGLLLLISKLFEPYTIGSWERFVAVTRVEKIYHTKFSKL